MTQQNFMNNPAFRDTCTHLGSFTDRGHSCEHKNVLENKLIAIRHESTL